MNEEPNEEPRQPSTDEAPPAAGPPGNPWERRSEAGFIAGYFRTLAGFVGNPVQAYADTRRKGDYLSPLLFALPVGWVGFAFYKLWDLLLSPLLISGMMPLLPPEVRSEMQSQIEASMQNAQLRALFELLLYPALAVLALFLASAVVHLVLLLAGGTDQSEGGFEGTFRTLAYGNVALLALVLPIPLVNLLAAVAWLALLGVLGLAALHGTTKGRAAVAVLVPLGLCCCVWCLVSVLLSLSATGRLEGLW